MERASPDGPQDGPGRLRSRLTNRSPDQDRPILEKDAGKPLPGRAETRGPDARLRAAGRRGSVELGDAGA